MSKEGRGWENKRIWHMIPPTTLYREVKINHLKTKKPHGLVKNKSPNLSLMLWIDPFLMALYWIARWE